MKKRIFSLILALTLTLSAITGCSGDTETPSGKTEITGKTDTPAQIGTDNRDESNETEPDYSDFVMPEETDTLVVYTDEGSSMLLNKALTLFQEKYPNIKIDHRHYSQDECTAILQAEIPAGKWPDLILTHYGTLPDIYKTMDSGVLADLNPYMANDPEFDLSDYNEGVMSGGVLNGKRYIVPINYTIPTLLTTEELLRENGIDSETLNTFDGFIDACSTFRAKNPDKRLFTGGSGNYYMQNLYGYSGLRMIDYENKTVSINEERFHKMIDLCKLFYNNTPEDGYMPSQLSLNGKIALFGNCENTEIDYFTAYAVLKYMAEETPLFVTIPNEEDGITASLYYFVCMPGGAQNKLNGYRLLKVLLSDEYQYGINDDSKTGQYGTMPVGIPVHTESMQKHVKYIANHIDLGDPDLLLLIGDEDADAFCKITERITDAVMLPKILFTYMSNAMNPYLSGKWDFDKAYAKLLNTLEIYKDE